MGQVGAEGADEVLLAVGNEQQSLIATRPGKVDPHTGLSPVDDLSRWSETDKDVKNT
jgi:hypothetical protein